MKQCSGCCVTDIRIGDGGYYQNIKEDTCALLKSLFVSHSFVDGNKRTAFAAFEVLLRIYGHAVTAVDTTLYAAIFPHGYGWCQNNWHSKLLLRLSSQRQDIVKRKADY